MNSWILIYLQVKTRDVYIVSSLRFLVLPFLVLFSFLLFDWIHSPLVLALSLGSSSEFSLLTVFILRFCDPPP
jgi:hypothetical protein